jgi:hypothetical protein
MQRRATIARSTEGSKPWQDRRMLFASGRTAQQHLAVLLMAFVAGRQP